MTYGELHPCEIHMMWTMCTNVKAALWKNYLADETEILHGHYKWCLLAIAKWWKPLGNILEIFDKMGIIMGTKILMSITFEPIEILIWDFQGCYCKDPGYWLMIKSNIHTSITFTPIIMGYCWMGPKPLKICKLIPSQNTPRYLKTDCRCSVPLSPSFHVHWLVHV